MALGTLLNTLLMGTLSGSLMAAALSPAPQPPPLSPAPVYNGPVVTVNNAPASNWRDEGVVPHYSAPALAADSTQQGLSLGGPRVGFSYISGGGYDKLVEAVKKAKPGTEQVDPGMSQFGWQAEYRFYRNDRGLTALMELIPLVGGLDQGLALPSVVWMLGLRGKNGFEFGVGPALGLNGAGLMLGTGYTMELGGINVPFNVAVGRGSYQTTSFAISTGFNL